MVQSDGNKDYNQILWHLKTITEPPNRVSQSLSKGTSKLTKWNHWWPSWKAVTYHGCPSCIIPKNRAKITFLWLKKFNSIPDYSLLSFPLKVQSFRPYWAQIKLAHFCYTLSPLVRKMILHEVLERQVMIVHHGNDIDIWQVKGTASTPRGTSRGHLTHAFRPFYSFFQRV